MAGATNDVHVLDVKTGKWEKIAPVGEPPSPRAAHAAAAVGTMVVIQVTDMGIQSEHLVLSLCLTVPYQKLTCRAAFQGGIGPLGLACEDLYVLDFTEADRPRWHR